MITFSRLGKCGRLGNQLWQVASTAGIAQTLGQSAGFLQWDYRPFFSVPDELFVNSLFDRRWPVEQADRTPIVAHIDPRAREYLQDRHLWENIIPQVREWFKPSETALHYLNQHDWVFELERPLLSVHVRRGDNAQQPNNNHPVRPWSYYEQAIRSLQGQFATIVVFSDDIEWCRDQFRGYEIEYPIAFFVGTPRAKEHEPAYKTGPILDWIDLQFMAMCDRHIISNSTYSWWGAYLSHDPAPIYPKPFFGSLLDYIDTSLMFPEEWVAIDHGQIYV